MDAPSPRVNSTASASPPTRAGAVSELRQSVSAILLAVARLKRLGDGAAEERARLLDLMERHARRIDERLGVLGPPPAAGAGGGAPVLVDLGVCALGLESEGEVTARASGDVVLPCDAALAAALRATLEEAAAAIPPRGSLDVFVEGSPAAVRCVITARPARPRRARGFASPEAARPAERRLAELAEAAGGAVWHMDLDGAEAVHVRLPRARPAAGV